MRGRVHLAAAGLLVAMVAGAPMAGAVDGVREINQACAEAGCFPGDDPGFPVSISEPGSYRLTSNLDLSVASDPPNTSAIEVEPNDVKIDLNGFAILGTTTCSGAPVSSCSPTGDGSGVDGNFEGNNDNIAVFGGTIRGMGGDGIECDRGCRVEDMHIQQNGDDGIDVSNGPGVFVGNSIWENGDVGFRGYGVVVDNSVHRNGGVGIFDNTESVVRSNRVSLNGGNGVRCNRCNLLDNNIRNNDGYGVEFFSSSGFGRNVIDDNGMGPVLVSSGTPLEVDTNVCDGDTSCLP